MLELTNVYEDKSVSNSIANIVYDLFEMTFINEKFKQMYTSYDDVYSRINRIKESEKNTILSKLEQMSDEQRDVDNEYKNIH